MVPGDVNATTNRLGVFYQAPVAAGWKFNTSGMFGPARKAIVSERSRTRRERYEMTGPTIRARGPRREHESGREVPAGWMTRSDERGHDANHR